MTNRFMGLTPEDAKALYHELSKSMHPDKGGDTGEFQAMQAQYNAFLTPTKIEIVSKTRSYTVVGEPVDLGPFVTYSVEYDGGHETAVVKMVKDSSDNDLMAREVKALKALDKVDPKYRPYFPELIENFRQRDPDTGIVRRAVAYKRHPGLVSLAEVHEAYPKLNARDWAWMFRRILIAVDQAHVVDLTHNALVPTNIFIHPEHHGVVLENWAYSSLGEDDGTMPLVPAIDSRYKSLYAPEVFNKTEPTEATDIFTLGKLMDHMISYEDKGATLAAFVRGTTMDRQISRPQSAAWLYDLFTDLIENLWGPRKFRAFSMPTAKESK